MHYYKRNLGDYAKKAGRLSMLQHGSYTLLIDACYDREQFPTLEEAIEWTWASTTEEIEAVTFVLRKFFTLVDGVYIQNRIQEEINDYHKKAETNKRISIDRETKRKEKSTNRAQDVNEPLPNNKPITNINKGSRLPHDWLLTQDFIYEAQKINSLLTESQIQFIADGFKDYWTSASGAKGVKSDWIATWRNWIRNQNKIPEEPKKRGLVL